MSKELSNAVLWPTVPRRHAVRIARHLRYYGPLAVTDLRIEAE